MLFWTPFWLGLTFLLAFLLVVGRGLIGGRKAGVAQHHPIPVLWRFFGLRPVEASSPASLATSRSHHLNTAERVASPRRAFRIAVLGTCLMGIYSASAQAPTLSAPGVPTISQISATSVTLHLPPLPNGATTLSLQRAVDTSAPLTPPPAAGRQLWLRADSFKDVSDGAEISVWPDSSGSGRSVGQSDTAKKPTFAASALNGHPAVHFSGNNQYFDTNLSGPGGPEFTFFVVAKGSQYQSMIRYQGGGGYLVYPWGGNGGQSLLNNRDGDLVSCGLVPGDVNIGSAIWKSNTVNGVRTYRNGQLVAQRNTNDAQLPNEQLYIGSYTNEALAGDVSEILVYNVALSDAQRQGVEQYLSRKYDVGQAPAGLNWNTIATGLSGGATYEDTDVNPATRYFYRCVAQSANGETEGGHISVTTSSPPPTLPGLATFRDIAVTHLDVLAPALSDGAQSLRLEKKLADEPNTAYTSVTSGAAAGASILVPNLQPHTSYKFRFVAVNEGGETPGAFALVETHSNLADGGSFENPALDPGRFVYTTLPGSPWTFDVHSGIANNNSYFGNGVAPEGVQVAFLQMEGSIKQTVSLNAGTYVLSFRVAARDWLNTDMVVKIDGAVVGGFTQHKTPNDWQRVSTEPFTVTAGNHEVCLAGLNSFGGDRTLFVDDVQLVPAVVTAPLTPRDGSFEVPNLVPGTFVSTTLTGSPWTFDVHSGIASNNTYFGNGVAPEGVQVAFLQMEGSIKQTLSLGAGTYSLHLAVAARGGTPDDFAVKIDGVVVAEFTQANAPNDWQQVNTQPFTVTAGNHEIGLIGLDSLGGDRTLFVDDVRIVHATPSGPSGATVTAQPDSYSVVKDQALTVEAAGVLENDTGIAGQGLIAINETQAAHGTLVLEQDGSFVYTPQAGYEGSDSFTYQAKSGQTLSAVATVSVSVTSASTPSVTPTPTETPTPTITPEGTPTATPTSTPEATATPTPTPAPSTNAAPVAQDASFTTDEDTPLTGTVTATDADGDNLTFAVVTEPEHGAVTLASNGAVTYTPTKDFNGSDSFSFKANDGTVDSVAATVSINVTAVNDIPTTQNANFTTDWDVAIETPLVAGDVDGDALTYEIVTQPEHGILSGTAPALTYTPAENYSGSDSFTFKVNDGSIDSALATVSLDIVSSGIPDNRPPVAQSETFQVLEHQVLTGQLHGTDPDGDPLTFSLAYPPYKGTVEVQPDGAFTYTPHGTDLSTFGFYVSDGTHTSDMAYASIQIENVNDAPIASGDNYSTTHNQPVDFYLNADDPDYQPLEYSIVTPPQHGTLSNLEQGLISWHPNLVYTPTPGFSGTDSLTFKASDGLLDSATVTITFTVDPAPGVDALIRQGQTGDFIGNDIYNATAIGQCLEPILSSSATTPFEIQVQNEGSEPRSLIVRGNRGDNGWALRYFDAATDGVDISSQVTSATGWSTPVLAVGASLTLRVESPPLDLSEYVNTQALISVSGSGETSSDIGSDTVQVRAVYRLDYRPDAKIEPTDEPASEWRIQGDNFYLPQGDNVLDPYYSYYAPQTLRDSKPAGAAASYYVHAQNDGLRPDHLVLSGPAGSANWSVHYFDARTGGGDITAGVSGAGWITPELASGETYTIRVEVTSNSATPFDPSSTIPISVNSESAGRLPDLRDVVTAITTRERLDLSIYTVNADGRGVAPGAGVKINNADGQGQALAESTYARRPAVFLIGSQATRVGSTYRYSAPAGDANWTVRYFYGDQEITEQITGAGWEHEIAPNGVAGDSPVGDYLYIYDPLRVEVTPGTTTGIVADKTLLIKATPLNETEAIDAVQATIHREPDVDVTIRPSYEDGFVGLGVYNTDGAGQTVGYSQLEAAGNTAIFQVRIHNHGNGADSFVLKAPVGATGWIARYFDAPKEGNDVTTALTSPTGWTTGSVEPGETVDLRLEVSPDPNTPGTVSGATLLSVTSVHDTTATDAVKATYGFQRIAKLQFTLDQGISWIDAPAASSSDAIPGLAKQVIGIRAVRLDDNLPWPFEPDIKPVWDHATYWNIGETVWILCGPASAQLQPIQAECGNVVVANLRVREAYRLSLRASKSYVPLGGGTEGQTTLTAKVLKSDGSPAVGVTVRFTAQFEGGGAAGQAAGQLGGASAGNDTAVTDADGNAVVTLTTANQAGAVSLQARLVQDGNVIAISRQQEVIFGVPEVESSEPNND